MTERLRERLHRMEAWALRIIVGAITILISFCTYFIGDLHVSMKADALETRAALRDHGVRLSVLETQVASRDATFERLEAKFHEPALH